MTNCIWQLLKYAHIKTYTGDLWWMTCNSKKKTPDIFLRLFQRRVQWRMGESQRKQHGIKSELTFYNFPAEFPLWPAPSTYLSHTYHTLNMSPTRQRRRARTHTRAGTHARTNDGALLKKAHWGAARFNHSDLEVATEQLHWSRRRLLQITRANHRLSAEGGHSPFTFPSHELSGLMVKTFCLTTRLSVAFYPHVCLYATWRF